MNTSFFSGKLSETQDPENFMKFLRLMIEWEHEQPRGKQCAKLIAEILQFPDCRPSVDRLWAQMNESFCQEGVLQIEMLSIAPPELQSEGSTRTLNCFNSRNAIVLKVAEGYLRRFEELPPRVQTEVEWSEIEALA